MTTEIIKVDSTRRVPLQSDWFDFHLDTIVYSFMVASATARIKPGDKKDGSQSYLYLSQSKYKKIRPIIRQIINKQARQINKRVQDLIDKGYVSFNSQTKQYTFPFDYNQNYYIVSTDVLAYLCTVSNPFVIKIYFYLADKYNWKKDYKFTYKQLRKMLGYSQSQNQRVTNLIKIALSSLSVMGFIKYKQTKVKIASSDRKIDNWQLQYVVGRQLPKIIVDQLNDKLSLEGRKVVDLLLP